MPTSTVEELHRRHFELIGDEKFTYGKALNEFTRTGEVGSGWDGYVEARAAREEFENVIRMIGLEYLIAVVKIEGRRVMINSNQTITELRRRYKELIEEEKIAYEKTFEEFSLTGNVGIEWDEYIAARAAREEFENVIRMVGPSELIDIVDEGAE